jgi:hypothetical protein
MRGRRRIEELPVVRVRGGIASKCLIGPVPLGAATSRGVVRMLAVDCG